MCVPACVDVCVCLFTCLSIVVGASFDSKPSCEDILMS